VLALLLACTSPELRHIEGPAAAMPAAIGLSPAVTLHALAPATATLDALYAGEYVGDIWFSGGFARMESLDNQVRSVGVELRNQDRYQEQACAWIDGVFASLLDAREIPWVPLSSALQPPRPLRTNIRGSGPLDGTDNQSLPRFDLRPLPLQSAPTLPAGTQAVLVPIVVHYYSHNGGWFVGQEIGNPAGARIRVLWSLYGSDGQVLTWGEVGTRHFEEFFYSPNQVQVQDYLIAAEEVLARQLSRRALQ
jgi:hypothetical protein